MLALLFVLAIAAVLAVWIGRRVVRRRGRQQVHSLPGRSPEHPLPFERFDEIDAHVSRSRCHCGGRLSVVSEGSRTWGTQSVRVVHCECVLCEQTHDLFFEQSAVLH